MFSEKPQNIILAENKLAEFISLTVGTRAFRIIGVPNLKEMIVEKKIEEKSEEKNLPVLKNETFGGGETSYEEFCYNFPYYSRDNEIVNEDY